MTITNDEFLAARSKGLSYQELLDTDTHKVPDVLRECGPTYLGSHDIPVERYTSRRYHELEKERLWRKAWQMACHLDDIPAVGDTTVYDITDMSIVLVRVSDDEVKAYWNACLHRGRALRDGDGRVNELRCPFHGYCWNLDGSLKEVPGQWDFPHVNAEQFRLPEVRVGYWGRFVFINMDPAAEPLEDFLGDLTRHFSRWPYEERYVQAHVARIMRCNWKIVQEAFSEAYHVVATHPQILAGIGDENSQYDAFGNFSRAITPNGTPSPHLSWVPSEQEMFDSMVDRRLDEPPIAVIPEGKTAREMTAAASREMLRPTLGDERADDLCDAELVDSIYYTVFPNFHPWGAYNRIVYRFRPNGDDHQSSIMECYFLAPFTGERPPAAPIHWLGPDDDWTEAEELGLLARVFAQDSFNVPMVQKGLMTMTKPGVTMGNYMETKIRHFHALYERHLEIAEPGGRAG